MTKLADLLVDGWTVAPTGATTLEEALGEILLRAHRDGALPEERARELTRTLAAGEAGEILPVNADVVAVLATVESLSEPAVAMAVAPEGIQLRRAPEGVTARARAVVLVLTPSSLTKLRKELIPEVVRVLRDPERTRRLVTASSVEGIRALGDLMGTEFRTRSLVEDAILPVRYRVYPDTPLAEVLDLMVRRGVRAIPVVGEQYEVLGILTSGDALGHLLHKGRPELPGEGVEEGGPGDVARARDVMTRTVLCVSEDQGLTDAANMMVNRDVEQLPVVREGELVGFVTRDSILRALYGARSDEAEDDKYESRHRR